MSSRRTASPLSLGTFRNSILNTFTESFYQTLCGFEKILRILDCLFRHVRRTGRPFVLDEMAGFTVIVPYLGKAGYFSILVLEFVLDKLEEAEMAPFPISF